MPEQEWSIYVAPDGADTNTGTLEQPVQTLNEALARTRQRSTGAKRIILREGRYYDVHLVLTLEDEHLSVEAYPGEQPILYGGVPVTSWEREGDWLSAPLEGVRDRSRDFRIIEAEGEVRLRARLPETGAFRHRNDFGVDWVSTYAGGWRRKPTDEEMSFLTYKDDDLGPWLDTGNAELTVYHEWDESLVGVKNNDPEWKRLTLLNLPGHPPGAFAERNENAKTYVVWNVREGMKRPGQWYLDRTGGKLVYWPLPSETAENLHVVAPTQEQIIHLQPGARYVRFKGLTLSCAATPLAAGGFGAIEASAAVSGENIQNVEFDHVTVRNTGGWACKLSGQNIRFNGCHFHHTGAGGVRFVGKCVSLENSHVHDVGLVYTSAVAVFSEGSGNMIRHNDIHGSPYSGIASASPNTVIEDNILYDTMSFMKDGSAIYIAMNSRHTRVSGNAVFSRAKERVRRYAYYMDERCEDCTVENNLAVNLGVPMLSHMTFRSRFLNNVFLDRGPQTVSVLNSFGLAFERNILAGDSVEVISPQGNPEGLPSEYDSHEYMNNYSVSDGIVSLQNNVIYSRSGPAVFKEYLHYKSIREKEIEENDGNILAYPAFRNPAAGDFSFLADSPATARGIRPLSFADAGFAGSFSDLYDRFWGVEEVL